MPEEVCDGMVDYFNRNKHLTNKGTCLDMGKETVDNQKCLNFT